MNAQQARFSIGRMFITPGALEALESAGQDAAQFLDRHKMGDWGDLSPEDKRENEYSVHRPLRIFSSYQTVKGEKLWVITEADRSSTTILLPCEY